MNDDLARLQRVWSSLGRDDPLWAVLSQPGKRGRRWDEAEFLATGRTDIETQLHGLAIYGLPVRHADSSNEVRLRIKLAQGGDARTLAQGLDGVEIAEAR